MKLLSMEFLHMLSNRFDLTSAWQGWNSAWRNPRTHRGDSFNISWDVLVSAMRASCDTESKIWTRWLLWSTMKRYLHHPRLACPCIAPQQSHLAQAEHAECPLRVAQEVSRGFSVLVQGSAHGLTAPNYPWKRVANVICNSNDTLRGPIAIYTLPCSCPCHHWN